MYKVFLLITIMAFSLSSLGCGGGASTPTTSTPSTTGDNGADSSEEG